MKINGRKPMGKENLKIEGKITRIIKSGASNRNAGEYGLQFEDSKGNIHLRFFESYEEYKKFATDNGIERNEIRDF